MKNLNVMVVVATALMMGCLQSFGEPEVAKMKSLYEIEAKNIDGENVKLAQYKGKVLLIVNTASKCGFTKQYEGLQKLYTQLKDQGLVVLGFPSNDFMRQEPGSDEEIKSFCTLTYNVDFPMFSKITVAGKDQHPLYAWLTSKETNPEVAGKISWNFNKFLIARDGKVIARFGSRDDPMDKKVVEAIESALKQAPEEKKNAGEL